MAAGAYNMTCEQGATFRRTFTWLDETEQPVNLTGCSARMQVRATHKAPTTWLSLTTALNGGITLTPLEGKITMVLSATATAALPVGKGVYDLEVVMVNGDVHRVLEGTFTVKPEVTR